MEEDEESDDDDDDEDFKTDKLELIDPAGQWKFSRYTVGTRVPNGYPTRGPDPTRIGSGPEYNGSGRVQISGPVGNSGRD